MTQAVMDEFELIMPAAENDGFMRTLLFEETELARQFDELVILRSRFADFYTQSCMVSFNAVRDSLPGSWEFLQEN